MPDPKINTASPSSALGSTQHDAEVRHFDRAEQAEGENSTDSSSDIVGEAMSVAQFDREESSESGETQEEDSGAKRAVGDIGCTGSI